MPSIIENPGATIVVHVKYASECYPNVARSEERFLMTTDVDRWGNPVAVNVEEIQALITETLVERTKNRKWNTIPTSVKVLSVDQLTERVQSDVCPPAPLVTQ